MGALFAVLLVSCDNSDPLRSAKTALAAQNIEKAEEALQSVSSSHPDYREAKRLMADVHLLKKEYPKSAELLDGIWKDEGLDGETSGEKAALKARIKDQYGELYVQWGQAVSESDDKGKLDEILRAGLRLHPKNARLNTLLVEHLTSQGNAKVESGQKLEGATLFEQALQLRTTKKNRKTLQDRAKNLRMEVFRDRAMADFTEKKKAEYTQNGTWNEDKKQLIVMIDQAVDKGLKPNKEEDKAVAQQMAFKTLAQRLLDVICDVSGIARTTSFTKPPKFAIAEEKFARGSYQITATIDLEEAILYAHKASERERKKKASEAKKGGKKPAGEPEKPKDEPAAKTAPAATDGAGTNNAKPGEKAATETTPEPK